MVMIAVNIELDKIEDCDLREELESRGYIVSPGTSGTNQSVDDNLHRIRHLLDCGLRDAAIEELIEAAGRALGRPL